MIHFHVDVDVGDSNKVKWRGLPIKVNAVGVARSVDKAARRAVIYSGLTVRATAS
ncbi:MAG: hypothetical protein QOF42_27 [Gammaproteobacteria bacterium]|nr:hypothetical protein [Gammaproteobacteria bacterium]